jgi:hypothetical protein
MTQNDSIVSQETLSWRRVLWLMPVTLLLHDAEEMSALAPWMRAHPEIPEKLAAFGAPGRAAAQSFAIPVSQSVLAAGFVVALAFAVTAGAFFRPRGTVLTLFAILTGGVFLHAFVHLAQALLLGGYVPGLVGTLVFVVPGCLFLYRRLLREGVLTLRKAVLAGACGILLFVPVVLAMKSFAGFFQM